MRNEKDLLICAAKLTLTKGKEEGEKRKVYFGEVFLLARVTLNMTRYTCKTNNNRSCLIMTF